MKTCYLHELKKGVEQPGCGNKAGLLLLLSNHGLRIPKTWICPWQGYIDQLRDPEGTRKQLRHDFGCMLDMRRTYAVRSSYELEDSSACSHAGIFTSVLHVAGADHLIGAIQSVWDSARQERSTSYAQAVGIGRPAARMAAIVQEMVPAVFSGVVFSRNPVTGADEVIVEAVRGSGELLMQGRVDPSRWVWRNGRLWHAAGDPILNAALLGEIMLSCKKIAAIFGKPVDVEWAYDGASIYWLQLRAITGLKTVDVYTNYFSKEFLPGMIKPLVWSINIPVVNTAWKRMLTELVGTNSIDINRLAKSFYYRAYFNTGVIGSILESLGFAPETLETIMGFHPDLSRKVSFRFTPRALAMLPRIMRFIVGKMRMAGRLKYCIAEARARFGALEESDGALERLETQDLLANVEQLCGLTTMTAYYNIAAWLNMSIYCRIVKKLFCKSGIEMKDSDLYCNIEGLGRFDPTEEMLAISKALMALDQGLQERIKTCTFGEFMDLPGIAGLQDRVRGFLAQFGYLSDSGNDFSAVQWREQPDMILRMLAGRSIAEDRPSNLLAEHVGRLPLLRRLLVRCFLRQARKFKFYKEAISATHNYGYSLFRRYFLGLAKQLITRGYVRCPEDIFFIPYEELLMIAQGQADASAILTLIESRQRELEECKGVRLPDVIYGDTQPRAELRVAGTLRGIGASGGYYSGRVKVVRGLGEIDKLEKGDVLVIPHSDVGLMPLFARASAVIAESGGMLCHSSIIAREYGIPAVIAVPQACMLADNTLVTVDGYRGSVLVHTQAAPLQDEQRGKECTSP